MAEIRFESYYGALPSPSDYISHHGIKGQKWYRRRFQNDDGSLTPAGRERYGIGPARKFKTKEERKAARAERKAAKAEAKAKKQTEQAEKDAAKKEADKQDAITKGDAARVMKYANEMSTQELNDALQRVNYMARLKDLGASPKKESVLKKIANLNNDIANAGAAVKRVSDLVKSMTEKPETEEDKARKQAYLQGLTESAKAEMKEINKTAKEGSLSAKEANAIVKDRFEQLFNDKEPSKAYKAFETGVESAARVKRNAEVLAKAESAANKRSKEHDSALESVGISNFSDYLKDRSAKRAERDATDIAMRSSVGQSRAATAKSDYNNLISNLVKSTTSLPRRETAMNAVNKTLNSSGNSAISKLLSEASVASKPVSSLPSSSSNSSSSSSSKSSYGFTVADLKKRNSDLLSKQLSDLSSFAEDLKKKK
jgi:hypothetical protein